MNAILLCLAIVMGTVAESPIQSALKVTYIGNTGFLIETQDRKIAIDALFGGWTSDDYDIPPDSVVDLMRAAQPPFDNIDIVAVTHWHADHFSASIVAQHMQQDTGCVVLCPRQVADRLAAQPEYAEISERVHVIDIAIDSVAIYNQNGISSKILSSHHGSYFEVDSTGKTVDLHRDTRNLEYLFKIGGHTVFHSGDAALNYRYRYQLIGLGKDSIDAAFVQWWPCNDLPSFREIIVREDILPRRIFFTHMAPGRRAKLAREPSCNSHLGVILATHSLESWIIPSAEK